MTTAQATSRTADQPEPAPAAVASRSPDSRGPGTTTAARLLAHFAEAFARIREDAVSRDRTRSLPRSHVADLARLGFGRLRLPQAAGGFGADLPQTAAVLTELAAADSNLTQIWRGHIAFVEDVLTTADPVFRNRWIRRIADGAVIGNAWSEIGDVTRGVTATTISCDDGSPDAVVDGRKFYTTGSIFADYSDTTAAGPDGTLRIALVPLAQDGVSVSDDWDGFGQRTTGTGTAAFSGARVPREDVRLFSDRFSYQTALYQVVLLATHAGIARAVARDTASSVRDRTRTYSHGNADRAQDDPQLLEVVGHLAATAQAAEALTQDAARALQRAHDVEQGDAGIRAEVGADAELTSARAQVVLSQLVPAAATRAFDALGASGVRESVALDRHWRNARTVASHNPWVYKARLAGAHLVSGYAPEELQWTIGVASRP